MNELISIDVVFPAFAILIVILVNVCLLRTGSSHRAGEVCADFRKEAPLSRLERFVVEHYVVILIDCMLVLPLFIQAMYSIPLCSAKVSAESVLSFWGVILGIVSAAFSYQKQKTVERDKRRGLVSPNLSLTLDRNKPGGNYSLTLVNHKPFAYQITKICGVQFCTRLPENDKLIIELDSRSFFKMNEERKQQLEASGKDSSKEPSVVSLELFDLDGTKWLLDYKWAGLHKWIESFRFFADGCQ